MNASKRSALGLCTQRQRGGYLGALCKCCDLRLAVRHGLCVNLVHERAHTHVGGVIQACGKQQECDASNRDSR